MIDCLVANRLAQSAQFGLRTNRAGDEARTLVHPARAIARCQCPAGRLFARARPTHIPVWPRLPPANEETSVCGWSRRTPGYCNAARCSARISPVAEWECELVVRS